MKICLFLLSLFLGACTSLPKVMSDANVTDVTYTEASQNIDGYKDTLVRWGGIIIDVENEETFSFVQVLYYPLSYLGRPQRDKLNAGRFIIKSKEFLDPVVYAKDLEITVVGSLNGNIQRMVGKKAIQVPLIQAIAVHLWPKEKNSYYGYGPYYGGYGPYFGIYNPYAHPFLFRGGWGGGYYRPYWY